MAEARRTVLLRCVCGSVELVVRDGSTTGEGSAAADQCVFPDDCVLVQNRTQAALDFQQDRQEHRVRDQDRHDRYDRQKVQEEMPSTALCSYVGSFRLPGTQRTRYFCIRCGTHMCHRDTTGGLPRCVLSGQLMRPTATCGGSSPLLSTRDSSPEAMQGSRCCVYVYVYVLANAR
jgi:hypothetical protein